jgi:hypothetical protein
VGALRVASWSVDVLLYDSVSGCGLDPRMRTVDSEERLYVGKYNSIDGLDFQKDDTVVNLSTACSTAYTDAYSNLHIPLRDDPSCRYADFQTAVNETVRRYGRGDTVAVVCGAGQSRSVSVAAAALSMLAETDLEEALARCKMGDSSPQPTLKNYAQTYVDEQKRES